MSRRTFSQIDVFAPGPLTGDPGAVVHDGADMDDATLAAFARWTNLSETTSLLPATDPAADYRLRVHAHRGAAVRRASQSGSVGRSRLPD